MHLRLEWWTPPETVSHLDEEGLSAEKEMDLDFISRTHMLKIVSSLFILVCCCLEKVATDIGPAEKTFLIDKIYVFKHYPPYLEEQLCDLHCSQCPQIRFVPLPS